MRCLRRRGEGRRVYGANGGSEGAFRCACEDRAEEGKYIASALPDKAAVDEVMAQLERATWRVRTVEKKETRRKPKPPFTTSQLQQQAAGRLGFGVRRTMGVAQRLYEGVELGAEGTVGLITYMRTDSTRMSPDAIDAIREHVKKQLGDKYIPEKPNVYSSKKDAQDAHEAIRPTNIAWTPEFVRRYVSDEQFRLYSLIWERAVTSQMVPAVFDQTTVDIEAKADMSYDFRTTGSVLKFAGFLLVRGAGEEGQGGARCEGLGRGGEAGAEGAGCSRGQRWRWRWRRGDARG